MTVVHVGFPSPSLADVDMTEWRRLAPICEELGFDTLWHSNERFYREMWVRMTVSAMVTERIGLGGAVVDPFAVHPVITAQSLATVAELSDGRAMLALGAGGSGFPMMGIRRERPARALREALTVMKPLLAGETVSLEGDAVTARAARLHFVPPSLVPLWVATRGDHTLRLAGELADGAIVATYARPAEVRAALGVVEEGARRAGRSLRDVRTMVRVDTCIHEDEAAAYEAGRLMLAKVLWSSYPDRRFVEKAGLEVPEPVEQILAERDYDRIPEAAPLIPDELVAAFSWTGHPKAVVERVTEVVREAGVNEVGFWLLRTSDQSLEDAVRALAADVLPAVGELAPRGT
ncbi:MAG: LLM class flavin-dependent oxidoreductase [Actinomycetota bacterium]